MSVQAGTCNPELIAGFIDQRLSEPEQQELEDHLTECSACRESLGAQTADAGLWYKASRYLKDDGDEPNPMSGTAICSTGHDRSLSINHVLNSLGPSDDPNMLGRLGSYEVSGVVGSGGMGIVLKGMDRSLDRTVAIKVLAPHLASSGAARKRFAREAKAAAAVIHPNVMAIHSVSNDESLPHLVMPYLRGASLQKRLDNEGALPVSDILRIGSQIASGLAAAHAQGLVHRDIKPANILLEQGVERVAITDFGLARAVDDATMTRTGVIAGTPQYMSPEQARGEPVDQRSDLFSLGSVLYTLCTARPPFRAETSYGVLRRITDEEPRVIREINPAIPEWLGEIIVKLMSKQPDDRFASSEEVAELLEDCLAHVQQPMTVPIPVKCLSLTRQKRQNRAPDSSWKRWTSFQLQTRRGSPLRLLVGAALACFVFFASFLIVLEFGKGTLIFECEGDDVPVRIMHGDKVVERLIVTRDGTSVRIVAGQYIVEIDGEMDGITIENGVVTLLRRGRETVTITRRNAPGSAGSNSVPPQRSAMEKYAIPLHERWEIRYPDNQAEFARTLDFFAIEMGVIDRQDKEELTYLSNLSDTPRIRRGKSRDEQRLYFGSLSGKQLSLCRSLALKANMDTRRSLVLLLYPKEVETALAALELEFAAGRSTHHVTKTQFAVRSKAAGIEFYVVSQTSAREKQPGTPSKETVKVQVQEKWKMGLVFSSDGLKSHLTKAGQMWFDSHRANVASMLTSEDVKFFFEIDQLGDEFTGDPSTLYVVLHRAPRKGLTVEGLLFSQTKTWFDPELKTNQDATIAATPLASKFWSGLGVSKIGEAPAADDYRPEISQEPSDKSTPEYSSTVGDFYRKFIGKKEWTIEDYYEFAKEFNRDGVTGVATPLSDKLASKGIEDLLSSGNVTAEAIERLFRESLARKPTRDELVTAFEHIVHRLLVERRMSEWFRQDGATPYDRFVEEQINDEPR